VKIAAARAEAFAADPDPRALAVLIYGPDGGLVRERAERLARTVVEDLSDPFRAVELTAAALAADPARLADEAAAIAFTGGRRVVRLRAAGDAVTGILAGFLANPPCAAPEAALVVVEAGELGPRSPLRRLFEEAANGAALPCYMDDGAALESLVRETLAADGVSVTAEALEYLTQNLGSDRMVTRSELEKLALYAGEGGRVGLEDAVQCVGDSSALSLEGVAFAAAGGESAALERALDRVFLEGVAPVSALRAVARHFQRLHLAAAGVASGESPERAMATLKPAVFFKNRAPFLAQLRLWPPARAGEVLALLTEAELDCKKTGMPAEALCRRALFTVADRAQRARRAA
jgi:DNA polymerase-3 subunit delta